MFRDLNPDVLEKLTHHSFRTAAKLAKQFRGKREAACAVASTLKQKVAVFRERLPFIVKLRNPGIKKRHFQQMATEFGIPHVALCRLLARFFLAGPDSVGLQCGSPAHEMGR